MGKIKNFVNKVKTNTTMQQVSMAAMTSIIITDMTVSASASSAIAKALSYVATAFFYIGIVFAVVSFAQLLLALKNDNADQQATQIRNLIIGAILAGSGFIINGIYHSVGGEGDVAVDKSI